jgi:hypothetical protein
LTSCNYFANEPENEKIITVHRGGKVLEIFVLGGTE